MYGKNFFVYGQISATLLPAVGNNKFAWRGKWGDRLLILRHGSGKQNPHSAAIALATPSPDPRRERRERTTTRPLRKKTLARLAAKGSVRFTVCTAVTLRQVCSFQFSDNSESEWIHPCVKKSADIARNLPDIDNMRIKMKPAAVKVAKGKSDYINLKPEFVCIVSSRKNLVGWCRNMSRMVSVSFSI